MSCFVCNKTALLMYRCSNVACGKVFCRDCGEGFIKQNCPCCGNYSNTSAGWIKDVVDAFAPQQPTTSTSGGDSAAAAEQRRLRESQERAEASQRSMEQEAREANKRKLELEEERLELERARVAEDKRQGKTAARFRGLTSITLAFVDKLLAAFPESGHTQLRSDTAVCFGAVCEILGQMLDRQSHGDNEEGNPYVTPDDFEQLRMLETRIADLRKRASCGDFLDATIALLQGETAIATRVIETFRRVFSDWQQVDEAYRDVVQEAVEQVRVELALLERHPRTGRDALATRQQIDTFCLADTGGERSRPTQIDLPTLKAFQPDPERIRKCLASVRTAFHRLLEKGRELTARGAAGMAPAIESLTARHLLLRRGDATAAVIDLGTLATQGQRNAFLEFSKPPALKNFMLDEGLVLFLNVAEDVAAGKLQITESGTIAGVYKSFLAAITGADRALDDADGFGKRLGERMAAAENIHRQLEQLLNLGRIQQSAANLLKDMGTAKKTLERALQLVQMGEISLGTKLAERAVHEAEWLLDAPTLDTAVEEQRAKWTTAEGSFSALQQEGTRQKTGWRGALGEAFFLNSHEELLRRLEAFYRHHASSSCGPGTEMGHRHGKLIRSTSTMLEYRPSLRVWFVVHDALERVTARPVSPDVAFFNALCAIASAHASIDETEEGVIRAAVLDAELAIDEAQMKAAIAEWRSVVSDKRRVVAVAQTVADVDAITDPEMLERLNTALKNVARADDSVTETEIAVYHAFLARIAQRMYADLVSS